MADSEYRQLLREYLSGYKILIDRVIYSGIRNGATLLQFREDGLPWQDVSRYLHFWNPAILNPDETAVYHQMLLQEEDPAHPDFIRNHWLFMPTSDDWHPSWPGGFVSMHLSFAVFEPQDYSNISARKTRKKLRRRPVNVPEWSYLNSRSWGHIPNSPLGLRLSFWGMDDTGMELDLGPQGSGMDYNKDPMPYPQCLILVDEIIRRLPTPLTRSWLTEHGFIYA